jgi:hypothetical protein
MYDSWCNLALLAMESSGVVYLRLMTMSIGGQAAQHESHLMVTEKVAAGMEAAVTLMTGGSLDTVVGRYREQVAANAERLTSAVMGGFVRAATPLPPTF